MVPFDKYPSTEQEFQYCPREKQDITQDIFATNDAQAPDLTESVAWVQIIRNTIAMIVIFILGLLFAYFCIMQTLDHWLDVHIANPSIQSSVEHTWDKVQCTDEPCPQTVFVRFHKHTRK